MEASWYPKRKELKFTGRAGLDTHPCTRTAGSALRGKGGRERRKYHQSGPERKGCIVIRHRVPLPRSHSPVGITAGLYDIASTFPGYRSDLVELNLQGKDIHDGPRAQIAYLYVATHATAHDAGFHVLSETVGMYAGSLLWKTTTPFTDIVEGAARLPYNSKAIQSSLCFAARTECATL